MNDTITIDGIEYVRKKDTAMESLDLGAFSLRIGACSLKVNRDGLSEGRNDIDILYKNDLIAWINADGKFRIINEFRHDNDDNTIDFKKIK